MDFDNCTLQGGMEHEAADSDEEVAKVGNAEDKIVAMFAARFDSFVSEV